MLSTARACNPFFLLLSAKFQSASLPVNALVVQRAPHLMHFIVNNVVMCVIRSKCLIVDVKELRSTSLDTYKLIVADSNGQVWMVSLPMYFRGLQPLSLQSCLPDLDSQNSLLPDSQPRLMKRGRISVEKTSPTDSSYSSQYLFTYAGLMQLLLVPSEKYILQVVCTGYVEPSMMITIQLPLLSAHKTHHTLIFDDLEGIGATCVIAFRGQTIEATLIRDLIPLEFKKSFTLSAKESAFVVLQGDHEGCLRYVTIKQDLDSKIFQSGVFWTFPEEIVSLVTLRPRSMHFVALLAIGRSGNFYLIRDRNSGCFECALFQGLFPRVAYMTSFNCIICLVRDHVQVACLDDLLQHLENGNGTSTMKSFRRLPGSSGTKQFSISVDDDERVLSLLYSSRRIQSYSKTEFSEFFASIQGSRHSATKPDVRDQETDMLSRVKPHIDHIDFVAEKIAGSRENSLTIDGVLRNLKIALYMQQSLSVDGHAMKCKSEIGRIKTGSFRDENAYVVRIRIQTCSAVIAVTQNLEDTSFWHIEVCVCSNLNAISCYSFPWRPNDAEQIIEISLDQMPYDYGIVMVDCSLVFTPRLGPCMEDMKLMPVRCTLLQNECLHLVAASKVVNATDGTQRKEASSERDWFTEVDRIWKDCGVHIEPRQIRGKSYKPTELILPVCLESFRQQFQRGLNSTKSLILKSFTGNLVALRFHNEGAGGSEQRNITRVYVVSDNTADLPGTRAFLLDNNERIDLTETEASELGMHLSGSFDSLGDDLLALGTHLQELEETFEIQFRHPDNFSLTINELAVLFDRIAFVETQTLNVYWKLRAALNDQITLPTT